MANDITLTAAAQSQDTQAVAAVRHDLAAWRDEAPVLDDVAWEPSEADYEDYLAWCRERDERLWCDRMRADADAMLAAEVIRATHVATFLEMLSGLWAAFHDHPDSLVSGVDRLFGRAYDEARATEAKDWEQMEDRLDVMRCAKGDSPC